MSQQSFDFQDLLQLVELMKSTSQFSEFKLRANGIELELRRGDSRTSVGQPAAEMPRAVEAPRAALAVEPPAQPAPAPAAVSQAPAAHAPHAAKSKGSAYDGADAVKAPMVGTVYLAPEPGAKPFVTIGQHVEADTQVCIVEVMKLMNSVLAGRKGVVSQILVDDGESVEYAQPLFVITPA